MNNFINFILLLKIKMIEKNQELTEIIVKPGKSSCLTIINDVKE
jgi:hypothetical protein